MKNLSLITYRLSLITLLTAMTACSSDDDGLDDGGIIAEPRLLTITQVEQPGTRATLGEENEALTASWTAGDVLTYATLSNIGNSFYNGPLTAKTTATTSEFTGKVHCSQGNKLAVIYPQTTTLATDNASYTISLTGQDGTLQTLATKYHYVYGVATVTSVTETTASATMEKMKSLLSVVKFNFADKNRNNALISVKSLTISYDNTEDNYRGYPRMATVTTKTSQGEVIAQSQVVATPEEQEQWAGKKLEINLPSGTTKEDVYVALLPGGAKTTSPVDGRLQFYFSVTDNDGNTYTGTAKAVLVEGEFVNATIKVQ